MKFLHGVGHIMWSHLCGLRYLQNEVKKSVTYCSLCHMSDRDMIVHIFICLDTTKFCLSSCGGGFIRSRFFLCVL